MPHACRMPVSLSFHSKAMMARAIDVEGVADRIRNLPREWKVASTCTGTGTFETALNAVGCAVSTHLPVEESALTVPCQACDMV